MPTDSSFIFLPAQEQIDTRRAVTLGRRGATGLKRLADRVVKCLCTSEGSVPSDLSYGTMFPSLIGSNVSSGKDLLDVVRMSVEATTATLQRYQSARPALFPTEEDLLYEIEILQLNYDREISSLEVTIRVWNQADQSVRLLLPPLALG